MRDDLNHCLELIAASEGGYSDHPADVPTNWGITIKTLAAVRGCPVTKQDVQALSRDEARQILAEQYADPVRFDVLPPGVDYVVLDASVNSGPDRAVKLLQQALGMTGPDVDGVLGLHTRAAVDAIQDRDGLIITYCSKRLAFMRSLRKWSTFGDGWTRRVERVQTDAMLLSDGRMLPQPRAVVTGGSAKATGPTKILSMPSGKAAVATLVTVAGTAGAAATQATGMLSPYSDIKYVRYALVMLALASSVCSVIVTFSRAHNGATT